MNQSDVFIPDRESEAIEWISLDEVMNRTREQRIEIVKKIWM